MSSWISNGGIWNPAKEYSVDPKAPKGKEIYEGPDRGAIEELQAQGVTHLGKNFKTDPEFIVRVRQLGFNSVDDYLKVIGYDEEKARTLYEKQLAEVNAHKDPEQKPAVNEIGGGIDTAGGKLTRKGGFDWPPDVPR